MTTHDRHKTNEQIAATRPLDQVIAAIEAGSIMDGTPLTDDDKAAIARVYRGETTVEQERARLLHELTDAHRNEH
ncbi:hypothetical protein [Gordonia sputi]|uniref:hypothetical protein n=1 Tax=Gordonia sputi TaxID=36823 RepID=UPI003676E697